MKGTYRPALKKEEKKILSIPSKQNKNKERTSKKYDLDPPMREKEKINTKIQKRKEKKRKLKLALQSDRQVYTAHCECNSRGKRRTKT